MGYVKRHNGAMYQLLSHTFTESTNYAISNRMIYNHVQAVNTQT